MSIRTKADKDHLKDHALPLAAVLPTTLDDDPLVFLTASKVLVDLHPFAAGAGERASPTGIWLGPFKGRPKLIRELAPALKDRLLPLAEKSVIGMLNSLRGWWRVFDAAEAAGEPVLISVLQLSNVHKQLAYDVGMRRGAFTQFVSVANIVRQIGKATQLYWPPPNDPEPRRDIPPTWQSDVLRHALKRAWYAVIDRWSLADQLLTADGPLDVESQRLQINYRFYAAEQVRLGTPRPKFSDMRSGFTTNAAFYATGLNGLDMLRGFHPDGDDIRTAFHLCLITTGWNPAVLLNIDVEDEYIGPHPKSPDRYILRSTKDRAGGAEMTSEGLFKTQAGAGFIIQYIIRRTAPLREELRKSLCAIQEDIKRCIVPKQLLALQAKAKKLEGAIRTPWLYAATNHSEVQWLHDDNYAQGGERQFLRRFIESLNKQLPADKHLAHINPTDLRDIYAANVYRASGGSILAVMKALGHRRLSSTPSYLANTLIRLEHRKLILGFGNGFWGEIRTHGRIDPTILAKISRHGPVIPAEEQRLIFYRSLPRTRVGTRCTSPHTPPVRIAPDFVPDGVKVCDVQRCLLCIEYAVILEDSLPGIARRSVELSAIRERMGLVAWGTSSFREELENVELALDLFDRASVEDLLAKFRSDPVICDFA